VRQFGSWNPCWVRLLRGGVWKGFSPRGDGNQLPIHLKTYRLPVWKGFSPRGDGNHIASSVWGNINIVWKGFSPRGDGNIPWYSICDSVEAMPGNAFPREGWKPEVSFDSRLVGGASGKAFPPKGDQNSNLCRNWNGFKLVKFTKINQNYD
jgi:hypothetical protein